VSGRTPSPVGGVLRVANCSGFYGDRFSAAREMVEGGPIDVLTGDYLAELTMLILTKARQRDPSLGYAVSFYRQMEEVLGTCAERGIKVVSNAGGLNPAGLAERLRRLAGELGIAVSVAHVEGDDVLGDLPRLQKEGHALAHLDTGRPLEDAPGPPLSAHAYLGGFAVAEALRAGADVVVTGRITDAALVVGPAAWRFGWGGTDVDALAGAVVAGHVIECGAQATGGNYSFFAEVPGLEHPGFPIAEMAADGSSVITKHPGTGGAVTVETVTAQLLYEIAGPLYANPDVVADFSTIRLEQLGPDRVGVSGVRGLPAPETAKVAVNLLGGWRNTMTLVLTGLDIEEKAALVRRTLERRLAAARPAQLDVRLVRSDRPDAPSEEEASAQLRVVAKDPDPDKVGRRFSGAVTELALASYPGFHLTSPPGEASAYGVYWPTLIPAAEVEPVVVTGDGRRLAVPVAPAATSATSAATSATSAATGEDGGGSVPTTAGGDGDPEEGPTARAPLGRLVGARSGDKGGNANVGLWARSEEAFSWLRRFLTVGRFKELLAEAAELEVERHELANLRALNFVVHGLLDEGVASSTRPDPQAKALGEYLRCREVDIPLRLLEQAGAPEGRRPAGGEPAGGEPAGGEPAGGATGEGN
jgi:hypothetical protein